MGFLDIFEVILLSSLIGSIIVAIILITKWIFKNTLTSIFHYYIWLILLIKLIIPFGPQVSLNISNIYENFHIQSTTNENIQYSQISTSRQPRDTNLDDSLSTNSFQDSNKSVISSYINISSQNKVHIEKVFFFIWIFGIVLLMGVLVLGHKKLMDILRSSTKNVDIKHKEILYNCMNVMNIRTEVELSYSSKISSPSLCGLIKPKILIPISVADKISDDEFKYIVMHELTHLKNKDVFINWVIMLLSIIYWFNPMVLYGLHKMRQDCEFSCDCKVISYLGQGENLQYGNALIRVLELVGNSNRLTGTTAMVMNNSEIKRRLIMISKYKKINIKSILLGAVVVTIIGGLGIILNTSKVSDSKTTILKAEIPLTTSENIVNNTSNESLSTIIKNLPSDSTNSIAAISSDIVIYNSHPDEEYPSGIKVTDIGALINDKLVKEGLKSSFLKCEAPIDYNKSYENTRKLLTENVKDYSDTILLDIHRDEVSGDITSDTRKILLTITKNNPYYEGSKKFAEYLSKNITNSNEVKTEIRSYEHGKLAFNQDLSKDSLLIELGNSMSSDSDIEACVNELVSALKDIQNQKALSN